MRQPQNAKRGRGRGRRGNANNHNNHVPSRNTSYESNGPDVKLRGNAQQLHEKYMALAHDAASSGERISAEAYTQFADHYFRLYQAAASIAEAKRQQDHANAAAVDGASNPPLAGEMSVETALSEGGDGDAKGPPDNMKAARRQSRSNGKSASTAQGEDEAQSSSADALSPSQLSEAVQDKAATS